MSIDYIQLSKQLIALLVVLSPIDVIPVYLSLTGHMGDTQRHRVLRRMIATVIVTLLFFEWTGLYMFTLLGIGLPSFQVAGGLILASMAWSMLHAHLSRIQTTRSEGQESVEREDVSIVPLAIPMLAGPGTITTIILSSEQQKGSLAGHVQLSLLILLAALVLYVLFWSAGPLFQKLGVTGARVTTRIMGMLLLAVAMEFILKGTKAGLAL